MIESFLIKGYKTAHIIENDPNATTELQIITTEIDTFPDDDTIHGFMVRNNLDRCEVVKSYKL